MSYPGGPPEWPDDSKRPRRKPARQRLKKNTRGVRVFSHELGYAADSFNPVRASLSANTGSRFDGTDKDPYGVCYIAVPDAHPHLAFWEVFQDDLDNVLAGRTRYIPKTKIRKRAFAYLRFTRHTHLVDVSNGLVASLIGTTAKVLQSSERLQTRAWARYVRIWARRRAWGLWYSSSAMGADDYGKALVLFEDRTPKGTIEVDGPTLPMGEREGMRLAKRVLKGTSVRIGP